MTGRPSRIHEVVTIRDPKTDSEVEIPLTEALCRYLKAGCFIDNAAEALGISRTALFNWQRRGREALAIAQEHAAEGAELEIPEADQPYVDFVISITRARAKGFTWHEANLRRHAENDGRLSLEYLARRDPRRYGKRIEIDHDPEDREPAPLEFETAAEVERSFDAANVPEGIDPDSVLPKVGE